jgi:hypothetical protein
MFGVEVGIRVLVGAGVMGENCLGFGVSVARNTYAREGKVWVGAAVGRGIRVDAACTVQAVSRAQTSEARKNALFIVPEYIQK